MTTPETDTSPVDGKSPLYYISLDRITQLGRSAVFVLAERRGPSAPSRLKADSDLNNPKELIDEIAEYSATDQAFIRSDMPLQEIVFRILLGRRNEPTPLRDLHFELTEKWSTPIRPISITERGLGRILNDDTYYGFEQQDQPDDG